jgi:hypothetical protein
MSETVLQALRMIVDPDLAGKTWEEVEEQQALDPMDMADGEDFCAVMCTNWACSNLARLILAGDDAALREFIELVDPRRLVRDGRDG